MRKNHEVEDEAYSYTRRLLDGYKPEMVHVDPHSEPEERESTILINDREDMAEISSAQKVVIRYLLGHSHFQVEEITMLGDKIVGVSGSISKKCIRITLKARKNFSSGFKRRSRKKKGS